MSHHKGSFTVRNLCVSVRLMDSDDNVNHDGLNLVYSRSGGIDFLFYFISFVLYIYYVFYVFMRYIFLCLCLCFFYFLLL